AARVAVPGAARLSRAARSGPGSETRRRRERREGRVGVWRWDETGGMVLETKGWGGRRRSGEDGGGCHRAEQPPQTSSGLPRPPLVLRQRREHRGHLAHRAGVSAARNG